MPVLGELNERATMKAEVREVLIEINAEGPQSWTDFQWNVEKWLDNSVGLVRKTVERMH